MISGFIYAVENSGLIDIGMSGYGFTWEKSRGTPHWVEEQIDRALVSQGWMHSFPNNNLYCIEATKSDHLPIFLDPNLHQMKYIQKRFRFENAWLQEPECGTLIQNRWDNTNGQTMQQKI